MSQVQVTAIVTAYKRRDQVLDTLRRIAECSPRPSEILVHVDGNESQCAAAIRERFPDVRVMLSSDNVGPGGGRNKLIAAASNDLVASFDDDSYPMDADFFARVLDVARSKPDAAVIASRVVERGGAAGDAQAAIGPATHFSGGGAVYRRAEFLRTGGYVSLPVAYGMEEVDLCIRCVDRGQPIYQSPWLRVYHDADLSRHADASVTAGSIANLALLVYLRYPPRYWPYGALQVGNRIVWLVKVGRLRGLLSGITSIPRHIWRHRTLRQTVRPSTLAAFLDSRHRPPMLEALQ